MAINKDFVTRFWEEGYAYGIPVLCETELNIIKNKIKASQPYEDKWTETDWWVFDVVTHPRILDTVAEVIGPNFYAWGSQVLCKNVGSPHFIPWHQDLSTWPFKNPDHVITVWVAIDDCDNSNGCLEVIPKSHLYGSLQHFDKPVNHRYGDKFKPIWDFFCDCSTENSVKLSLKEGDVLLMHSLLLHSSGPNFSKKRRCGIVINYATYDAKFDLEKWSCHKVPSGFLIKHCKGKANHSNLPKFTFFEHVSS